MTFRFNSVMFRFVNNSPETPSSSPLIYKGRNLKRERPRPHLPIVDFQGASCWFQEGVEVIVCTLE